MSQELENVVFELLQYDKKVIKKNKPDITFIETCNITPQILHHEEMEDIDVEKEIKALQKRNRELSTEYLKTYSYTDKEKLISIETEIYNNQLRMRKLGWRSRIAPTCMPYRHRNNRFFKQGAIA